MIDHRERVIFLKVPTSFTWTFQSSPIPQKHQNMLTFGKMHLVQTVKPSAVCIFLYTVPKYICYNFSTYIFPLKSYIYWRLNANLEQEKSYVYIYNFFSVWSIILHQRNPVFWTSWSRQFLAMLTLYGCRKTKFS